MKQMNLTFTIGSPASFHVDESNASDNDIVTLIIIVGCGAAIVKRTVAAGGRAGEISITPGIGYTINITANEITRLPESGTIYKLLKPDGSELVSGDITIDNIITLSPPDIYPTTVQIYHENVKANKDLAYAIPADSVMNGVFIVNSDQAADMSITELKAGTQDLIVQPLTIPHNQGKLINPDIYTHENLSAETIIHIESASFPTNGMDAYVFFARFAK
jgi:hypothetical protein